MSLLPLFTFLSVETLKQWTTVSSCSSHGVKRSFCNRSCIPAIFVVQICKRFELKLLSTHSYNFETIFITINSFQKT